MKRFAVLSDNKRQIEAYFSITDPVFTKIHRITGATHKMRGNEEYCELPLTRVSTRILKENEFTLSKSLTDFESGNTRLKTALKRKLPVSNKLYPFQREGVEFIEKTDGRCLIADEMGLGKTVQALSWLKINPDKKPVLIICPSSLKLNWREETQKWVSKDVQVLNGMTPEEITEDIVVINYDILYGWLLALQKIDFEVVIADEGHYIKNNKARRTKAFKRLIKPVPHLIVLSGTPIENRPAEIYNIVYSIDSNIFPNYISFIIDYCGAKKNKFGWDVSGSRNTEQLNDILKNTIMIRRKKRDVLKELPPKLIVKVSLVINNKTEYKEAEDEFIRWLKNKLSRNDDQIKRELEEYAKRNQMDVDDLQEIKEERIKRASNAPTLARMETLKQLAVKGKMPQVIEWIQDFLEDSGEKLVVFAIHRMVVNELMEKFKNISVRIDGSVTGKKRHASVQAFQNDDNIRLLVGNVNAAGVGLTLTAASNAAFIQFPWSPGMMLQAQDRVHRITQTKQVTIWNLIASGTIEEHIINVMKEKEKMIAQILDGSFKEEFSVLNAVIHKYV